METTIVHLPNQSRVFIVENVLDQATLDYAHGLAAAFAEDNPLWHRAGTAEHHPRWEYDTSDISFAPVKQAFSNPEHLAYWKSQLAPNNPREVFCSHITFFIDYPGSPPLLPHKEGSNSWLSQVYIAKQTHKYGGTTVYNDRQKLLFQLPYRDNMGWLFDNGATVMHGRSHPVAEGIDRFSLMIWYALIPD